jgi:hypothetical protein
MTTFNERRYRELQTWLQGNSLEAQQWQASLTNSQHAALWEELQGLRQAKEEAERARLTQAWEERHRPALEAKAAAARARLEAKQAEQDRAAEAQRARREDELKAAARLEWLNGGGNAAEFEGQWPAQHAELLRTGRADELLAQRRAAARRFRF